MTGFLSSRGIQLLRMLLIGILAQPAAAALIHNTSVRYPIAAAIVPAVEAAILAWSANVGTGSTVAPPIPLPLQGIMTDLYKAGSAAVDHPAPTTPPGVPPTPGAP